VKRSLSNRLQVKVTGTCLTVGSMESMKWGRKFKEKRKNDMISKHNHIKKIYYYDMISKYNHIKKARKNDKK